MLNALTKHVNLLCKQVYLETIHRNAISFLRKRFHTNEIKNTLNVPLMRVTFTILLICTVNTVIHMLLHLYECGLVGSNKDHNYMKRQDKSPEAVCTMPMLL